MIIKNCANCGIEFSSHKCQKKRFCSRKCFHKKHGEEMRGSNHPNFKEKTLVSCEICSKEIKVIPSRVGRTKVCSLACRYEKQRRKPKEKQWNWKGGIKKHQGYIYIYKPEHPFSIKTGYIFEHRLVMEKHLGRYLNSKEVVHHLNGDTEDNRIENLKLFKSNGEHLRETACHKK